MRARELAEPFPTIAVDADAMKAAQEMAHERLPGLIVCNVDGMPYTILPGSQVLRFLIPPYVQEDPALARAFDEKASDDMVSKLRKSSVGDLLPKRRPLDELPVVAGDATTIEVAAVMARMRSPLVAVVEHGQVLGAITVSRLLTHLLPGTPQP
jgi:predicted transcriptional regulator